MSATVSYPWPAPTSAASRLVQCRQCKGWHLDVVAPGLHAVRHRADGVLIDCRNQPIRKDTP